MVEMAEVMHPLLGWGRQCFHFAFGSSDVCIHLAGVLGQNLIVFTDFGDELPTVHAVFDEFRTSI